MSPGSLPAKVKDPDESMWDINLEMVQASWYLTLAAVVKCTCQHVRLTRCSRKYKKTEEYKLRRNIGRDIRRNIGRNIRRRNGKKALALLTATVLSVTALGGCARTGEDGKSGAENKASQNNGENGTENSGNTQNTDQTAAMGRYMESEINLPEGMALINDMKVLEDGRIRILGMSETASGVWESADEGATWNQPYAFLEELAGDTMTILCGAIADDGSVFCGVSDSEGDVIYAKLDSEGQYTQVTLQLPEDSQQMEEMANIVYWIQYAQEGKWLVQRIADNRIFLIDDANGEVERTYNEEDEPVSYWWKTGGTVLVFTSDEVLGYDYETGKETELDEVFKDELGNHKENLNLTDATSYPLAACEGEAGVLYYCNADGIYRYSQGGSVIEQLADGKLNSLSKPSLALTGIQVVAGGTILVTAMDEGVPKVLCYHFDEDVPSVPGEELNVYALEENAELQQAISMFQTENPEYYVNLEIGLTGDDAVTASDALRTLNTEIMAGNGPDILILDGMPVESYIEKGILEDISSMVEQTEMSDGIFSQIAETFAQDGRIYAVPCRFQVPVLQADAAFLDSINSLSDLADTAKRLRQEDDSIEQIDKISSIGELLEKLYTAYSQELVREDGSIDSEAMRTFISNAKDLFELNHYNEEAKESYFSTGGIAGLDMTTLTGCMDFLMGNCKIAHNNVASMQSLAEICTINAQKNLAYKLMPAGDDHIFVPKLVAGINSKSSQTDGAREFITFLLSQKAQEANQGNGLPVNRAAFEASLGDAQSMESYNTWSMMDEDGNYQEYELHVTQPSQEEREHFTQLVESLDKPCLTDAVMRELVTEQAGNCLKGDLSVEEAVNTIEQKMNLYLAE